MENKGAHNAPRTHHGGGVVGGGGREDCWSEGATAILIEAWGDRYVRLNRGNLRQKDWKEVADAVNARQNGVKPRKSDIQCKNRIDTLKKKYKLEKAKPPPSKWPFYYRIDSLIGNNAVSTSSKKPPAVTFTVKRSKPKLNPNPIVGVYSGPSSLKSRLNSSGSTESSFSGRRQDDDDDDDDDDADVVVLDRRVRKHRMDSVDFSDEAACRELARAILKFGEIYERIESSKQQQLMELERQRMEFTKDLECQRLNMFMEAQLELEKRKRPKYSPGPGNKL
ncbi:hypothetical protein L1049_012000 [Liquidambar formosana]|uniref:Myb/SANT-like DNA-binding domain-containing protein n=1 Tax=Liquidambar formosana TaxID=63359 RepID=A0AAP0X3L9_LIQFO